MRPHAVGAGKGHASYLAEVRFFSLKSFEWTRACDMANSKAGTALRGLHGGPERAFASGPLDRGGYS
jgi:hypothetical protein